MRFNPMSEQEVLNLLNPGEYDFLVKNAEDTRSKSGNEMIKLTLCIWDNQNREHTVFDYLLEAMMYKVKHFADSVGLESEYVSGAFAAHHCMNKTGRCKIIIDDATDSNFPPKNAVKDYIKSVAKPIVSNPKNDSVDSDIPF
jgi:hypothetical protein